MPRIVIRLPSDRTKVGELSLYSDEGLVIAGPFPAIGRSSQGVADHPPGGTAPNPTRDPIRPYGDTPTGEYYFRDIIPSGDGTTHAASSYGSSGVIRMWPSGGQALEAERNGRTAIFIHAGDLYQGRLKGTSGCIRLFESDMAQLVATIRLIEAFQGLPRACSVVPGQQFMVTITTADGVGPPEDPFERDPPPGGEPPRAPGHPRPRPGNPNPPSRPPRPGPGSPPPGQGGGHGPNPGFPHPLPRPRHPAPRPLPVPPPTPRPSPPAPPSRPPRPAPGPIIVRPRPLP
jgi:hypothetical protein